ncbi:MAG: DUF4013 domain-containing protein [Candidatus Dormibacteraceae bacterium]
MNVVDSFSWPFRGRWRSKWAVGLVAVLFLPVLFVIVLGYAIAATRQAEVDPSEGPPTWRLSRRLVTDGIWATLAVLLASVPFIAVFNLLAGALFDARVWPSHDAGLAHFYARVLALLILALPWGIVLLVVMPHATATFAAGGRPRDMFDVVAAARGVRRDFATWNLAAAAIVTGWALGIACVGLLCVGLVPGIFYAILVSAHASASLQRKGETPPAR